MRLPSALRRRRHLDDRDIWHGAAVTILAVVLSAGLVWVGYLVHVLKVARHSALQPPRRMVVLVFGRRLENGHPVPDYRRRLARALSIAQDELAERVLLLGGNCGGPVSEATVGHRWLRQHGLPAAVPVALEQVSADSLENLRHARAMLREEAAGAALPAVALVSSRYHLARCLWLARRLGFVGVPIAAESRFRPTPGQWGRLLLESAYVMALDVGLRWAGLIGHRRMAARLR